MNFKNFNLIIEVNKDADDLSLKDLVELLSEIMDKYNDLEPLLNCKIKFLDKPPIVNVNDIIKDLRKVSDKNMKSLSINNENLKPLEEELDLFENI